MSVPGAMSSDPAVAISDVTSQAGWQAPALGRRIWHRVLETLPEAAAWEPALVEAGPPAAEAMIRELAANLTAEEPPRAMHAAALGLSHARQFARDDVPLTALLRVYALGHELWREFFIDVLREHVGTADELADVAGRVSAVTFAYLHAATQEVVDAYEDEHLRVQRSGQYARRQTLNAILAGESVDPRTVTARLGVDLRGSHTALVAWAAPGGGGADPAPALERLLHEAAERVGISRPLVFSPGSSVAFAWLTRTRAPGEEGLSTRLSRSGLATSGMALAAGGEAAGVEGFRSSHRQALAARRFATPGASASEVVCYREVELASLLAEDFERAAAFTRGELGALAGTDEAAARLRATLSAFLASESSATRTAERLDVHKNTVINRVRQAEQARGAPLHQRRLELEAALRLARALPGVLD